ncbi:MAG TPA: sigma-54 dependent transcriptional regulator [Kofleriaceae bacterium]|nr:sigma-54 dependent transcriptional regulator [Kofleriaceae bacterium]
MRDLLADDSYDVEWIDDPARIQARMKARDFDVLLLDIDIGPDSPGLALCRQLTAAWPDTPVVVMTREKELETVVGAIRSGAYDFINKPVLTEALHRTIERAIRHRILRCRLKSLTEAVENIRGLDGFVGSSPGMRTLYTFISKVADADTSVLIAGESGTGKELVARAIHQRSARHDKPFVAINCGAVPAPLLESELFGHVKGAFTDAKNTRQGLFARAEGGTLLLDEIGEMPFEMQAKLLRVLQERRVRPVGGDTEIEFDARVIAASNRDLEAEVAAGRFREDLYYRINVVQIDVPPLRARGNDVLRLAEHFTTTAAQRAGKEVPELAPECARKLLEYDWPGNVRELENALERAVALSKGSKLTLQDLPERIARFVGSRLQCDDAEPATMPSLAEVERSYIHQVLEAVGGNKTQAAKVLALDRRTLYRRLEKFDRVSHASRA